MQIINLFLIIPIINLYKKDFFTFKLTYFLDIFVKPTSALIGFDFCQLPSISDRLNDQIVQRTKSKYDLDKKMLIYTI
jgi:hypothetical protein